MTKTNKIIIGGVALAALAFFDLSGSPTPTSPKQQSVTTENTEKVDTYDELERTSFKEEGEEIIKLLKETEAKLNITEDKEEVAEQSLAPLATKPAPTPKINQCHPSYSGCLNPNASDYDCAGGSGNGPFYTGPVQVYGYDEYGLDRDGDGWGCDN